MDNYAAQSLWMQEGGPSHPLATFRLPDDVLVALDEILGLAERAQPLRVAKKRQAFRRMTQLRELLDQQAELLAASLLVRAGIPFDFAAARPDLVLEDVRCGIEVTTRALDDQRALHGLLKLALAGLDLQVVLTFDGRPLKLGEATVDHVVAEDGRTSFRFDDVGLSVGVAPDVGFPPAHVTTTIGAVSCADLTDYNGAGRARDRQCRRQKAVLGVGDADHPPDRHRPPTTPTAAWAITT